MKSRQAPVMRDALHGIVRQAAQWLAQDRVDMFLSLGHHLDVALRRSRFPQGWQDADTNDLAPLLWQIIGLSRVCQATLQIRIAPEKYSYLTQNLLALPLLRFLASGSKRRTNIRHFLSEYTGKEVNPNTTRQLLTKLSELELIHQPYKRERYDLTFLGRQQLRLFGDHKPGIHDTVVDNSAESESFCGWLNKLDQLGDSFLNSDAVVMTKCDVWLTSWPQDACGWGTDDFLFPQKRLRFLILGNQKHAKDLVKQIYQYLPPDQLDVAKTATIDIRHIDASHIELSQVSENGHYCHLVSKHDEGLAFGSQSIKEIELVTSRPLACRDTLLNATGRLGIELNFLTPPPITYGQSMRWLKKQYDAT